MGQRQCGRNTDDWSQSQHQSNHDTCEITGENRINDDEDVLVLQITETDVNTGREEPNQEVQVKEKGGPSSRLVLRNRCNDGNMNLGVVGVPKGVESAAPWRNGPRKREPNDTNEANGRDDNDHAGKELLELLGWDKASHEISKGHQLKQTKDA